MSRRSMLEEALLLAERGFHVFPLAEGTKIPLGGSRGFRDATTDAEQIATWWGEHPRANIGIATGLSGLLVIDIDTKGGVDGFASFAKLKADLDTRRAPIVDTPSGGAHVYFRDPTGKLGSSTGKEGRGLGAGLDTRGVGGYVVAPPSIIDGKRYRWRERS